MLTKRTSRNFLPTKKPVEVGTAGFQSLKIDNNSNWDKAHRLCYSHTKFTMLCNEDNHTTLENIYYNIYLLHLFPFHHVMWLYILGKLDSKRMFNIKKKVFRIMAGVEKRFFRELLKKFNMLLLRMNFYSHYCLLWTIWKIWNEFWHT
jgi:hypothetical protein